MYKISIIIPVYNVEDKISKAFESIYNQTFGFENLEVIFIDDSSTDNSRKYIQSYMDKYSNVKGIFLDENSGFAGKPRNVGISIASAEYLMFLNPDDIYLSNACEVLYETIINTDDDIVSANYFRYSDDNSIVLNSWNSLNIKQDIHINSIRENYNLLKLPATVWTKIIRKDFIMNNEITFPEDISGQDSVFVTESLIKAKGIHYINIPIIKHLFKNHNKNKSITPIKNKKVLAGYLNDYFKIYDLLNNYDKDISWLVLQNLCFWSKQLIESNISLNDRIDLLNYASFLFEKFMESRHLKPKETYETFFNLIYNGEFEKAARFSIILKNYLNDNLVNITEIKNKDIYFLFCGFDIHNDLIKSMFNRANVLDNNGFNVKLLNVDPFINYLMINHFRNYESIEEKFRKLNYINNDVEFYNIYDYYSKKNTVDFSNKNINSLISKIKKNITILDDYIVQKINNDDDTVEYNFYDKKYITKKEYNLISKLMNNQDSQKIEDFFKNISEIKIKSEKYINDYLVVECIFENGYLSDENLYTIDGFNYFTTKHYNNKIEFILKDRIGNFIIKFNSLQEFNDYFVREMCLSSNNKPFLINDCSGKIPTIKNIDSDIAYKINSINLNSYKKPYINQLRPIEILDNIQNSDALITLTDSQKEYFEREFNLNNVFNIPPILFKNSSKRKIDDKKISIFSRISSENNLSDIIYTINIIKKSIPDVRLEIYGKAMEDNEKKEKQKLNALIEALNLQDNIIFHEEIGNVSEEISKSLVTIITSEFEGVNMVILESMINSVPVISYDLNYDFSDIIINDINGYLIEQHNIKQLSETIKIFLKNPKKSLIMGTNAYNYIKENFSENTINSKWEELFKKIISYNEIKKYEQYIEKSTIYTKKHVNTSKEENQSSNIKLKEKITDLTEENQSLNNKYTKLNERNTLKNDFINKLKGRITDLTEENQSLNNKYAKLNEKNNFKKVI